jgi:hypothetical protein
MPEWTTGGWLAAIAFMAAFIGTGVWIWGKIRRRVKEDAAEIRKDIDKRIDEIRGKR